MLCSVLRGVLPSTGAPQAYQVPLMEVAWGRTAHCLLLHFFPTLKIREILIAQRTLPNCFDLHNISALWASMSLPMPCSITTFIFPAHSPYSFPILSALTPAASGLPWRREGSEGIGSAAAGSPESSEWLRGCNKPPGTLEQIYFQR